jgi:predicted ATPase/DNA-binding winged helix-turn-helix (wHTH) protein
MEQTQALTFDAFRLEPPPGGLCRGDTVIALRPRSLAVLRYLVIHAGRLVTKAELRQHVWGGTHVSDTVLRVCIQEIRAALGDTVEAPQYVETVAQHGYQFRVASETAEPPPQTAGPIVGRQPAVERLEACFQGALHGARQIVLVSGDAGIGKTTVVDCFLVHLAARSGVRIGRGQCVEHYGEDEPYLPFLEALWQLAHGPVQDTLLAVLRRYAPLWLVQLPGLVSEAELERLQRQVAGATPARMRRELTQALDVLAADAPLVLVLEDLQWSDRSTVDLLAALAQRREPAQLLVLGTYRPVDVVLQAHPLHTMVQELGGRGQVSEVPLELLTAEDAAAYLAGRLRGPIAPSLAAFVYEHTDGNALFMVNIVEHLVQQRLLIRCAGQWTLRAGEEARVARLPEEVRQLLMRRLDALPAAARRVLDVASVVGREFTGAAVAAGTQSPVDDVEGICDRLAAHGHFIADTGLTVWPDGTRSGRYRFHHALYPQVLYEALGTARRGQLHHQVGACLEAAYGARAGEIAAQLAVHFERGGVGQRAVHYWQQAGANAAQRHAHHEAIAALTKGLALLATLPDSSERAHHELTLLLSLGELLMAAKGWGSPEVGEVYTRAHALCHQVEEQRQRYQALQGLYRFHVLQAQLRTADELSQQIFHLASHQPDPVQVLEGHIDVGYIAFYRGDLVTARTHLEHGLHLCDTQLPPSLLVSGGHDARVTTLALLAFALWALGAADQARQRSQEALAWAQQVGHPPSLGYAEIFAAVLSQLRREALATQARADAVMALAAEHGFGHRIAHGRLLKGWALAMQGDAAAGVAHIQQGLEAVQGTGLKLYRPYLLTLLAEAYGQAGQPEAGLTVLAEACTLVEATEERWWEAEVYRLKGALLRQLPRPDVGQAEACFQQALHVARRQQAKALELRAAVSCSQLWLTQGKRDEARVLSAPLYGWFTEGFDTVDLQEARTLLEALA